MKLAPSRLALAATALLLGSCSSCEHLVIYQDISPNTANGATEYNASAAGLTYELAGDDAALYAVSLNAGIWKSENGGEWKQLEQSPRYTTTMAVDPTNRAHLVAGERNADPWPPELSQSGVWESNDGGTTWSFSFSPLTQPDCRTIESAAVPAVFFAPNSNTLLLATPCGIGRRISGGTTFDFSGSPAGIGIVQAFVASRLDNGSIVLWARSTDALHSHLLWSANDGASWTDVTVPGEVDGFAIDSARGQNYTVAAYRETALFPFRPGAASLPSVWDDTKNFCTLLYYDRATSTFHVQQLPNIGDGTGTGGRMRMRTYLSRSEPGGGTSALPRIYFIAGQDVDQSVGTASDGLTWSRIALTRFKDSPTTDNIHADLWDVHWDPATNKVRLASDGGVYLRGTDNWVTESDGLHTHHIHSLVVQPTRGYPRIAYTVTDNSEWFHNSEPPQKPWHTFAALGDGSWAFADAGGKPVALLFRHDQLATFTDFGEGMPIGATVAPGEGVTLVCTPAAPPTSCAGSFMVNSQTFAVVQTLPNETVLASMDVALLASPPFNRLVSGTVSPVTSGPLANVTSSTGGPLLLRNFSLTHNPDANSSNYQGWTVVSNNVPAGATRLWVSNGHFGTVYYVTVLVGRNVQLFQRAAGETEWKEILVGATILQRNTNFGPVYVDPYDPSHILVITADGIRIPVLTPGEKLGPTTVFTRDLVLTALVTNSGEYPLSLAFKGGSSDGVVHPSQATEFPKAAVAQIAFPRGGGGAIVAASPVTGLFYQKGTFEHWQSLTPVLPKPFTMVSTVGMDDTGIFVGFEGRGIGRIMNFTAAKTACYYDRKGLGATDEVAQLMIGPLQSIKGATINVTMVHDGVATSQVVTTTALGQIILPGTAGNVVRLSFAGNKDVAPCETSFQK